MDTEDSGRKYCCALFDQNWETDGRMQCRKDDGDSLGTIVCSEDKIWVCSRCDKEFRFCPYCGRSNDSHTESESSFP
jgi:hypothetical protein